MKVQARLNNLRMAPRKVRLVTRSISGLSANEATITLSKQVKRASEPIAKLLRSAMANAENNFGLDCENLYIATIAVDEGARLKRWQPHAFGRATPLLKRLSKVTLVLEERIEGLNRKDVKATREEVAETVVLPAVEGQGELSEQEEVAREAEAKKVEEHIAAEKQKRDTAVKAEMKERKNVVKRTYQRKSF